MRCVQYSLDVRKEVYGVDLKTATYWPKRVTMVYVTDHR
jgi:hypothetical protein